MSPTEYPEECIRGIPNTSCLCENNTMAHFTLFPFREDDGGPSGWIEESISWMDDGGAIDVVLSQTKKDDQPQFKVGIAILARADLDRLKRHHHLIDRFEYERRRTEDNPYHGNLLLSCDVKDPLKQMFRSQLAMACVLKRREDLVRDSYPLRTGSSVSWFSGFFRKIRRLTHRVICYLHR